MATQSAQTASPTTRSTRARRLRIAGVALLSVGGLMATTPAVAAIINVLPDIVLWAMTDVTLDATESDVMIRAMDERQCFVPAADLQMDDALIPATQNNLISCHFFHLDPVNNGAGVVLDGKARFDGPILGVISSSVGLNNSDGPCGLPGVMYATGEFNRGLEPFQVDGYRTAGNRIEMRMDVPSFSDQLRVITCCGDACDPAG